MSLVIRAAARTLPAAIRDRYREQWLADARDAAEAGLRPSAIALAAVAFAITYDRPLPARRVPMAEQRAQRSRLAVGLALSAALLALSAYPRISFRGLTGLAAWDYVAFLVPILLLTYAVLAPLVALVLVRGARRRWAIVLLALASTAPIVEGLVNNALPWQWSANFYMTPGAAAYLAALVLVVGACALLWRPGSARSTRAPLLAALGVWLVAGLGLVYGNAVAWSEEVPLAVVTENPVFWAEWEALRAQHEAIVTATFWGWATVAGVGGILVFVVGRRLTERDATALGLAALAVSLLGASAVFGLLELGISDSVWPPLLDPLRLVAQVLLVCTTLVAVGGVRYLPRVGHAHDVEGGVELL